MKIYSIATSFILLAFCLQAQNNEQVFITHDDVERSYWIYVPDIYNGDTPVPLLFNFHGYTSNGLQQMQYGDFRMIADTANFIIVHPEGELLNNITHWNVGGWTLGSEVDDVGFTAAMIDKISSEYNINEKRIYSTGMSNGGFFSYKLACQLSERIAAVASVTGSMTQEIFADCNPTHPMPIMEIHGNNDGVIPYGGASWTEPIEDVLNYWTAFNFCNGPISTTSVEDTAPNDQTTADHIVYTACQKNITNEHFLVYNGTHTWPGTILTSPGTSQDFNASEEIWKFFSRYDIDGPIADPTATEWENVSPDYELRNNVSEEILILTKKNNFLEVYTIFNQQGLAIQSGEVLNQQENIDISGLASGFYFMFINGQSHKFIKI